MSVVRLNLDAVYKLYDQRNPSDATRAASNFLVENPDSEAWCMLIADCQDSGMLGFFQDVTDLTLQRGCFTFELHQMMVGVFRHADDPIRSEAWKQKYREAQGDAIVDLAEEGCIDEAAAKFKAVIEEAKEDVFIPEHLIKAVCRAGNPMLLRRVAEEYYAWDRLDPDAAERVIGQLRENGEAELAATYLRRYIGGDFLASPTATRLLMEVIEDTGDLEQAEQLMKDINEHVTDSAADDESDRYLGELAPTYAIFATMGAHRWEKSRTQAVFEQALELTEVGCSGKAWCETLHRYADWLEEIGDKDEAKWQRSRIVSAPERYASVDALISRWLVTRTAGLVQEGHDQLNAILDQMEHPILEGKQLNRLLPLVLEFDGRPALRNVCEVLWHRCLEDGCCPIGLAGWLIAVNHNGLINGPDGLQKHVQLGSVVNSASN